MYNNSEIINTIILSNKSLEEEVSLNILNVLKHYTDKHNYKNEDVMIIVIGANVVWYTTLLGVFKYSVLTFESFPDNYYILKKNFCRNHKNFFNPESTITIVNKTIYPIETFCDYYKDLKNRKKDFILCDKTKEKNLDKDYIKINTIRTTKLNNFIPLLKHKRITLLIFDLEFEGEKFIESDRELISKYHIPFVFIEFNVLMFKLHEKKPQDFLQIFIQNGYKISLHGFLSNKYISITDLLKLNFDKIYLYIIYVGK